MRFPENNGRSGGGPDLLSEGGMPAMPGAKRFDTPMDSGSAGRIEPVRASAKTPGTTPAKYLTRIAVRTREKIVLVPLSDVLWIQSNGNLLCLHLETARYEHRMTIQGIYRQLDPERFLRIHRSAIVNLDHVVAFALPRSGEALVHLSNGVVLPISRSGRVELRRTLSHFDESTWAS